jgi:hypothetical protein
LLSRHRKAPEEASFVYDPSGLYIRKEPKGKNTMSKILIGKVALVTGGSRSIGAVNVKGLFVATQEAVRHMGEGGRIINIGSSNSDHVTYGGGSLYVETLVAN